MILNEFEAVKFLANGPIIFTYDDKSEASRSTGQYVNQGPDRENGQEIWEFGQFLLCPLVRFGIECKGEPI